MKIGFLDSGLGGLIILKSVAKELPDYDYEYYGDTANLPYGDKSEEEILALTKAGVIHLFERDCALVIVACNTASAESLRKLQDTILVGEYSAKRILGVIIPTVEAVVETGIKDVALIATRRTVESKKYDLEFAKLEANINLLSKAISELVPLIEANKDDEAFGLLSKHLEEPIFKNKKLLILGCTHYSVLKDMLRERLGKGVVVISQDELIPGKLKDYLERHPEIKNTLSKNATRNIFLTDTNKSYDRIIANLLGGALVE